MSGGRFDYAQHHIDDIANEIFRRSKRPLHIALAKHLKLVYNAVHDLDWEWSGDSGEGDADEAIKKVVSKNDILAVSIEQAEESLKNLEKAIKECKKEDKKCQKTKI